MRLFDINIEDGLELAERVDRKYKPVFDKFPPTQRAAIALYFLPHKSQKEILGVTRPRVIKWYCPFAQPERLSKRTQVLHKCIRWLQPWM